jgi:glycosyltransferase involved in cell wall biosynthesis
MAHRIAFVVNNAAFFVSHRLPIAVAARAAGYEVALFTGQAGSKILEASAGERLAAEGITHRRAAFKSAGQNPLVEIFGLMQLAFGLWRFRPDVVHCVSPKGILYGGVAARWVGCPSVVLAVSGMGYMFTGASSGLKALLRRAYGVGARFAYGHASKRVIVQNQDDLSALIESGLASMEEFVLIPGSGVNLKDYEGVTDELREPLVVLPARMLKDKGVIEFAQAAEAVRKAGCDWRFALVGTADYQNPTAVSREQIQGWVDAGTLEWWGHREDMANVFAQASIVCLPSYREGMPKALLEAAAAGCAVVTTDVVGCREAVLDGQTGDLVPARDSATLSRALLALINEPQRRASFACAGRRLAASRFGLEAVVDRTLSIYQELIHSAAD